MPQRNYWLKTDTTDLIAQVTRLENARRKKLHLPKILRQDTVDWFADIARRSSTIQKLLKVDVTKLPVSVRTNGRKSNG